NTAQINPQKDLVNQPKTTTHVPQKLPPAKQINSPMTNLTHGIQNKHHIKRSTAYINPHPTKLTPYHQPLHNPQNIINP
ncbi:hypothetical protein, partial [Staphylococcus epidermidis]|uniref:hypothetical protein n=1 Tax=Staphylococcus epidermidis TaxID=1282 RepID=UPI001C92D824